MDKKRLDPEMVQRASKAIEEPEVQEMLKRLSNYGLGIFLPHMHLPEGGFSPLPAGTVSLEKDLQVSFVDESDPEIVDAAPVGWRWDESAKAVVVCVQCSKTYHH
ncbi:MAG: hypothetical protein JF600_05490 [Xanthomonadales bacterium]|nr:hypothetical protein [Xanthomonadales bacterium]